MKTTKMLTVLVLALGLMVWTAQVSEAGPMGTAFTYQGRLMDKNKLADGPYSFQFRLYDSNDPCTGTLLGSPIDINDLDVIDGHFIVELDFGSGIFDGNAVWLETRVVESPMGSDPATLSPLLELTPTPYALYATKAAAVPGGTTNYIPKFLQGNKLGNSVVYEANGNIGIGTSSPEKRLDIASESYTDLGIGLNIKSLGGTSWGIDNDGGVFKIVEHATCGPEFLNNTRIAVVGNCIGSPYGGNVGIGTDSPDAKLEVNGDLKVTGAYKGNIGPNNGAPFPRPAYDSGWVVGTGDYITLFHNIGGNVDNYVVQAVYTSITLGYNGNWYDELTTSSITTGWVPGGDYVRIRIWVYN